MKLTLECAQGHKWKMEIGDKLEVVECPICHHYAIKLSGKEMPQGAVIKSIAKGRGKNEIRRNG